MTGGHRGEGNSGGVFRCHLRRTPEKTRRVGSGWNRALLGTASGGISPAEPIRMYYIP
jgi:hypothetical protein